MRNNPVSFSAHPSIDKQTSKWFYLLIFLSIFLTLDLLLLIVGKFNLLLSLIIPLIFLGCLMVLIRPEIGLYLIILAIPFDSYYFNIGFLNISVSNALILLTLSSLLLQFLTNRFRFQWDTNYIFLSLILLSGLISTFIAIDFNKHTRSLVTVAGCCLTYFLAINIIRDRKTLKRSFYILGFAVIALALFGITQSLFFRYLNTSILFGRSSEYIGSTVGPATRLALPMASVVIQDKNAYAFFLLTLVPAFIYMLFTSKEKRIKAVYLMLSMIGAFAIFLSYSRGAWLGFVISAATIILVIIRNRFGKLWPTVFAAVGFIIFTIWVLGLNIVSEGVYQQAANLNVASIDIRLNLWGLAWNNFLAHPLLGLGFEGFISKYTLVSHNGYLQVLVALGIIGFIPFVILIIRSIVSALRRLHRDYVFALLACLIALLVASFFIDVFLSKNLWLLLGMLNAACMLGNREA